MQLDMTRTMIAGALVASSLFVVGGFAVGTGTKSVEGAPQAREVAFTDSQGQEVGTATLIQTSMGLLIRLNLDNVPAGVHGVRVGDRQACEAIPDDPKLLTVHAGADGRIRAEVLTEEFHLDAVHGQRTGRSLFIGLRPVEDDYGITDLRAFACAATSV